MIYNTYLNITNLVKQLLPSQSELVLYQLAS